MIHTASRRPLAFEALEPRHCPSGPGYTLPETVVPLPRTDALSVAVYAAEAPEEAAWKPNVVVLGDSIPYLWAYLAGAPSWANTFGPLNTADFAVPGGQTQNVLWQLDNGALRAHPKVVLLSVGINNLQSYDSVDDTIAGIVADVEAIRGFSPSSKIILTGILPFQDPPNFLRYESTLVNAAIATIANGTTIVYTDPGSDMIFPDGTIDANFQPDLIHPNLDGYEIWGSVIIGTLADLLTPTPTSPPRR